MSVIVSVVAPCFNEARNLPELVERLTRMFERKHVAGEIVLVNDGSSDDTGSIIDELARQCPCVRPLHHPTNRGIEAGWRTGIAAAQGVYVCLIDADLQNLPEDVYRLLREIQLTGADVVQGYRSSVGRLRDSRYILSKGLNWILNTAFAMNQRDNKSGFVIARKEILDDILAHRYVYRYFQTFIAVAASSKAYTIREIETLFESRLLGKSFLPRLPIWAVMWCLVDVAKAVVEFRLSPKRESILGAFLKEKPPSRQDPELVGWRKVLFRVFCLTMPLHKWMITRQARHYYYELKKSQYLSPASIRELQEKKLRRLIDQAYYHVRYYRERMDALGLTPSDIRTLDDLEKLPLLSKDDVREFLYFDLLSDNHDKRRILKVSTSGSTGEPFVCYADQHQLEIRWATTQRSIEWTGYRFGDRSARLWHQTLGMSRSQVFRERIDAWLNRRLFVPAFEMSDAKLDQMVDKLAKYQPVLIDGYAESFNFLAQYIKTRGLRGLKPKGIISSAQVLPPQSREIIGEAFGCGVFDKYGSREFSGIAYECDAHDGHHVVAESYIVEILKDGTRAAPGEVGEVVITDLNNFCMPLIRYRVGDLAVAMAPDRACACGRGLPRIGAIEGRVQAIIVGQNGTYLPSSFFFHVFKDYEYVIRQFQVIQDEVGVVKVRVIKAPRFDEVVFAELMALLRRYLGEGTRIDVEFTDRIEMVRTGKHQGSISRLNIDFQSILWREQRRAGSR
jgi:phenylacetate-coenzyme A ligase PaaK-like adenylate-forming protein